MKSLMSRLNYELNPKNDLHHLREYVFGETDLSGFYSAMKPLAKLILKPLIRGATCGAIVGAGISYAAGLNIGNGAKSGAFIGLELDYIWSLSRLFSRRG